jgi:protein-S-isoprenylcysteine O-methyltransferase
VITLRAILLVISALWIASEIGLAVLRRSGSGATRKDAGSLLVLNAVIYVSVALGMFLGMTGRGRVSLPIPALWLGLGAIVAGLAVRWWAVLTLRRFFTVDVAIHADHRLVETGPYRFVRHPAYVGMLLSFAGLALCASGWVSALVILVPIVAALLYRIRVEERALLGAFPSEYRVYAARTARLFPGVY